MFDNGTHVSVFVNVGVSDGNIQVPDDMCE